MLLLVLHYDGTNFSGWQRQPDRRTVQGELENALSRLCAGPVAALGSGRTDAGVHARGQAVGVRVPEKWAAPAMRRALNALLPDDLWVADAHAMRDDFHARYSATARAYSYYVGTDDEAASPFRRRTEWVVQRPLDGAALALAAGSVVGEHCFRGFAVQGTAPADDDHRCAVRRAEWRPGCARRGPAGDEHARGARRFNRARCRQRIGAGQSGTDDELVTRRVNEKRGWQHPLLLLWGSLAASLESNVQLLM